MTSWQLSIEQCSTSDLRGQREKKRPAEEARRGGGQREKALGATLASVVGRRRGIRAADKDRRSGNRESWTRSLAPWPRECVIRVARGAIRYEASGGETELR